VGCEFLDPITPQYISDAVCWGAIGARTVESQITVSSAPACRCLSASRTGPTAISSGGRRGARRRRPHAFAGIDVSGTPAILHTRGNRDCHVILRGGKGARTTARVGRHRA